MTRALLLASGMALSILLAGCGDDTPAPDAPKEWKAYVPPVQTGALVGTGAVVPDTGTGSVKDE